MIRNKAKSSELRLIVGVFSALLSITTVLAAKNICGRREKYVADGEKTEQICNFAEWKTNCEESKITHIEVNNRDENGTCHCADGFYRHSNGSCLTLKECGFPFETNPCGDDERIFFDYAFEKVCIGGNAWSNGHGSFLKLREVIFKGFNCYCPNGQIRMGDNRCGSLEDCQKVHGPQSLEGKYQPYPSAAPQYKVSVLDVKKPPPVTTTTARTKLERCGTREKLVVNGAPKERICDNPQRSTDECKLITHVYVNHTENGTCHCADGFYRHSNGSCLTLTECGYPPENICGRRESYVVSGEPTEQICDFEEWKNNCEDGNIFHVKVNHTENGACHCAHGFYRHSNGSCLTLKECGFPFDKNPCDGYERIVFDHAYEKTCDGLTHYIGVRDFRCYCPFGQIRTYNHKCEPIEECQKRYPKRNVTSNLNVFVIDTKSQPRVTTTTPRPKLERCGAKEKLVDKGAPKERFCDNPKRSTDDCNFVAHVQIDTENGTCHCVDGLYRHSNGSCLTLKECGFPDDNMCGSKEKYVVGGEPTEQICNFEEVWLKIKEKHKLITNIVINHTENGACHCADGFYRHSNGSCLTIKECGYKYEKSPCGDNERIAFISMSERTCISNKPRPSFYKGFFKCYCYYGQVRMDFDRCAPIRECQEKYPTKVAKSPNMVIVRYKEKPPPVTTTTPRPKLGAVVTKVTEPTVSSEATKATKNAKATEATKATKTTKTTEDSKATEKKKAAKAELLASAQINAVEEDTTTKQNIIIGIICIMSAILVALLAIFYLKYRKQQKQQKQ